MNNLLKKIAACLTAFVMMVLTVTSVSAAGNTKGTITVPADDPAFSGHSFAAYQIFQGTQSTATGSALGTLDWGTGINVDGFIGALKNDEVTKVAFNNESKNYTAQEVADILGSDPYKDNVDFLERVAKLAYNNKQNTPTNLNPGENELASGYYLVVDVTKVGVGDSYNAAILKVTADKNTTIKVKKDEPTVEKKVLDTDYTAENNKYGSGYNDAVDANIGDELTFHLIAKIPNYTRYDSYYMQFTDVMSKGLTFTANSTKVYLSKTESLDDTNSIKEVTNSADSYTKFTLKSNEVDSTTGKTTLVWENNNIKNMEEINAVVSATDKTRVYNFIIIEYKATLNENAVIGNSGNPNEVELEYSNNPNVSSDKGKTEKDYAVVLTFELDVNKVETGTENKLGDATFKLGKRLTGTTVSDYVSFVKVEDGIYRVAKADDPAANKIDSIVTVANQLLTIKGLDDGTYYLEETVAPDGYNRMTTPQTIVIASTIVNGQDWDGTSDPLTGLTIKVGDHDATNGNVIDGSVQTKVENSKGTELPETGGMGTTMLYIAGGILVLGSVVFFITNRKMRRD